MEVLLANLFWVLFGVVTLLFLIPTFVNCIKRNWVQSVVRFGVFLVGLVLSVAITALITKLSLRNLLASLTITPIQGIVDYILADNAAGTTFLSLVQAIAAPIVFFVLFCVIELILLIVYTVVSSVKLKKLEIAPSVGNRVVSVVLNVFLFVGSVATFFMPLSFYVSAAAEFSNVSVFGQEISLPEEASEAVKAMNENPANKLCKVLNTPAYYFLTNVKTEVGSEQAIPFLKNTVNGLSLVLGSFENFSKESMYSVASTLRKDPVSDRFIGGMLTDATESWAKGEDYLGVIPALFPADDPSADFLTKTFHDNETASGSFSDLGSLLAMQELSEKDPEQVKQETEEQIGEILDTILEADKSESSSFPEDVQEDRREAYIELYTFMQYVSPQTITMIKDEFANDPSISDNLTPEQMELFQDTIFQLMEGMLAINQMPVDTPEQQAAHDKALVQECVALGDMLYYMENFDNEDPTKLEEAIKRSNLLSQDVKDGLIAELYAKGDH